MPVSQRPSPRGVVEALPEQNYQHTNTREPQHDNRQAHDCEQCGIERCALVKVTRHAARGLDVDNHHFENHDRGDYRAHGALEAWPYCYLAEHPGERCGVNSGRDAEFRRLQPGWSAGDHAWIEKNAQERSEKCSKHEIAGRHEQRAIGPEFMQHVDYVYIISAIC